MNFKKRLIFSFSICSIFLLSHCSQRADLISPPLPPPIGIGFPCAPSPTVQASVIGPQVIVGTSVRVKFLVAGLCNGNQFKVAGSPAISTNLVLEINDVFYNEGAMTRPYYLIMVDATGAQVGSSFTAYLSLIVFPIGGSTTTLPVATTTTTIPVTTTSTTLPLQAPSCTIERLVSPQISCSAIGCPQSAYPPTSNDQQSIWVRFTPSGGGDLNSTFMGRAIAGNLPRVFQISTYSFPFFEMDGESRNQNGSSSCHLSVQTSYCIQSVTCAVTPTSVTTELTVIGRYDQIYIQGVAQGLPFYQWPWVVYTENFSGSSQVRQRTSLGLVTSLSGDRWSCPVSYSVPNQPAPPPPPPANFLTLGQTLNAGQSLVPVGPNICGCSAVMQGDGNFVVYRGNSALWNSRTFNNPGANFSLQTDGNLVVRNGQIAKWDSQTYNKGAWQLHMQADCNLVLYSFNFSTAVWNSRSQQAGCY